MPPRNGNSTSWLKAVRFIIRTAHPPHQILASKALGPIMHLVYRYGYMVMNTDRQLGEQS